MPLDFHPHYDRSGQELLFRLEDADYLKLQKTFDEFSKLTGVEFELYGDSYLSSAHSKVLLKLLKGRHSQFSGFISSVVAEELDLLVTGD